MTTVDTYVNMDSQPAAVLLCPLTASCLEAAVAAGSLGESLRWCWEGRHLVCIVDSDVTGLDQVVTDVAEWEPEAIVRPVTPVTVRLTRVVAG